MQTDEPLGLSVHNLPRPDEVGEGSLAASRWKFLAIALVCSLPVLAAYFAYFVVRPQGHASIGELISPVRAVGALQAKTLQGESVQLQSLKGQWLLVSVGEGACATECAKRLYLQRQLRETLGKDKDRVDRVWLVRDDAAHRCRSDPDLAAASARPRGRGVPLRGRPHGQHHDAPACRV
jgi:hypothetical protein